VHGIWKAQTARDYHSDFKEAVAPLLGKPWPSFIDLSNWKTSYPEVVEIIGQHMDGVGQMAWHFLCMF